MYYSWRVRVLSGRSLVTIISWIGSFLEVVGSITVTALLEVYGPVTHVNTVTYAAIATISMDVIVDDAPETLEDLMRLPAAPPLTVPRIYRTAVGQSMPELVRLLLFP